MQNYNRNTALRTLAEKYNDFIELDRSSKGPFTLFTFGFALFVELYLYLFHRGAIQYFLKNGFIDGFIDGFLWSLFDLVAGSIISWYFFLSIRMQAASYEQLVAYKALIPIIDLYNNLDNKELKIEEEDIRDLRRVVMGPVSLERPGPLFSINTIDTSGPYLWISGGLLEYEGVYTHWSKKISIASGIKCAHNLFLNRVHEEYCKRCKTNLGEHQTKVYAEKIGITTTERDELANPTINFSDNRFKEFTVDGISIPFHGRVERIFIWSFDDILSSIGCAVLAFHYGRGYPTYILPLEWVIIDMPDFIIWDVFSKKLQPSCHPAEDSVSCFAVSSNDDHTKALPKKFRGKSKFNFIDNEQTVYEMRSKWLAYRYCAVNMYNIPNIKDRATLAHKIHEHFEMLRTSWNDTQAIRVRIDVAHSILSKDSSEKININLAYDDYMETLPTLDNSVILQNAVL